MTEWLPDTKEGVSLMTEELLEFIPDPLMITDNEGLLLYANPAFRNLTQKETASLLNVHYGDALGCKYFEQNTQGCGKTYYCEFCEIRRAFNEVQTPEEGRVVVRETVTDGTSLVRILRLYLKKTVYEGKTRFIGVFKPLGTADLESDV